MGWGLLDYLIWADESSNPDLKLECRLSLPAMQRNSLWRPSHVLALWHSVFDGMPLGSFYLNHGREGGATLDGEAIGDAWKRGFDLLDGQQRTRTLMLCLRRFMLKEKRCLWVGLDSTGDTPKLDLFLTTGSQPFGYRRDGTKLSLGERRDARLEVDKFGVPLPGYDGKHIVHDGRPAYDHELFDLKCAGTFGLADDRPPKPHLARGMPVLPLVEVMEARESASGDDDRFVRLITEKCDGSPDLGRALVGPLQRLSSGQIGLILAEPPPSLGEAARGEWLLSLFGRIGSGGVPLSDPEKIFSIYKHHDPGIRDAVAAVQGVSGHLMLPTDIVRNALRIATAENPVLKDAGYWPPDPKKFAAIMADPKHTLPGRLKGLIGDGAKGRLAVAFSVIVTALAYCPRTNPKGLPAALRAELDTELLEVLLYWAVRRHDGDGGETEALKAEICRFALFWHLCVHNQGKAIYACYPFLRRAPAGSLQGFPSGELARAISEDGASRPFVTPDEMLAYANFQPSDSWRSATERFGKPEPAKGLYEAWWGSNGRMLLWLQRDFFHQRFSSYNPAAGRDDDQPFDLDHVQPQANWGSHWTPLKTKLVNGADVGSFEANRWHLGNAIGNLWWMDGSKNRSLGKADVIEKLAIGDQDEGADWGATVFDLNDRAFWRSAGASDARGTWTPERMEAFQLAVERRTLWLYREFWRQAEFATSPIAARQAAEVPPVDPAIAASVMAEAK